LNDYVIEDPLFQQKLDQENKNIDDCVTFILNHVQKSQQIGFSDEEVFKLARHYYDEENIDLGKPVTMQEIKVNESLMPSKEEIEEAKKEARERLIKEEMQKRRKASTTAKKKSDKEEQQSLF
jgi:hypothetical protein